MVGHDNFCFVSSWLDTLKESLARRFCLVCTGYVIGNVSSELLLNIPSHQCMCNYSNWQVRSVTNCPLRAIYFREDTTYDSSRLRWAPQANQPFWLEARKQLLWDEQAQPFPGPQMEPCCSISCVSTAARRALFCSVHPHMAKSIILTHPSPYVPWTGMLHSLLGPDTVSLKALNCNWDNRNILHTPSPPTDFCSF